MKVKLADELAIANFGELDLLTEFSPARISNQKASVLINQVSGIQ